MAFNQTVSAEGALKVADISSTLRGASAVEQIVQPQQQYANDTAFSALSAFAQQLA